MIRQIPNCFWKKNTCSKPAYLWFMETYNEQIYYSFHGVQKPNLIINLPCGWVVYYILRKSCNLTTRLCTGPPDKLIHPYGSMVTYGSEALSRVRFLQCGAMVGSVGQTRITTTCGRYKRPYLWGQKPTSCSVGTTL